MFCCHDPGLALFLASEPPEAAARGEAALQVGMSTLILAMLLGSYRWF